MPYISRYASLDNAYIAAQIPAVNSNVVTATSDTVISAASMEYFFGRGGGYTYINTGASGTVKFTLPEGPSAGVSAVFINEPGTHAVNVVVSGSDTMTGGAAGGKVYATSTQQGAILKVSYVGSNVWVGQNIGAWTFG